MMPSLKSLRRCVLSVILLLCSSISCTNDDVQDLYSHYRAFFSYNRVSTAHPLRAAVTGFGQYCAIYAPNNKLYFQSPYETYTDPLTASDFDYKSVIWISGLIVGQSNVIDMTDGTYPLLCFDRVCSNCYKESSVSKPLTLKENGIAVCSKCHRQYDLNNGGISTNGIKLERYRITYDGMNNLLVNNRY